MTFLMSIINSGIFLFMLRPYKKVVSRLVLTASGPRGKEANAEKNAGFPLEYPLHGSDGCKASFL